MALLTPFYNKCLEYGAQFEDIAGWQMAAVYSSIEEEYWMIRERAGFTDTSFQSSLAVVGSDAFTLLQRVLVSDLSKTYPGKAIYSIMLDETAKPIDECIVFWVEEDFFLYNGYPKKYETIEWLRKHAQGMNVSMVDMNLASLAFSGPKSRDILQKAMNLRDLPYFGVKQDKFNAIPLIIARLSFVGELGYELYISPEYAHQLWDDLVELGKGHDAGPFGGAAFTIAATEKGHIILEDFLDLYEGATPLELGFEWTVAFHKDFIGKEALLKRKSDGLKTKLVGFEVSDQKVVASAKDNLIKEGKMVGQVTADGVYGPAIGRSIGRGWIEIAYAHEGEELEIEHENKRSKIKIVRRRWYDPENMKVRG